MAENPSLWRLFASSALVTAGVVVGFAVPFVALYGGAWVVDEIEARRRREVRDAR